MSRCYGCCQENCGFLKHCSCPCHGPEGKTNKSEAELREIADKSAREQQEISAQTFVLSQSDFVRLKKIARITNSDSATILSKLINGAVDNLKNEIAAI
jgi:hypothetical protein